MRQKGRRGGGGGGFWERIPPDKRHTEMPLPFVPWMLWHLQGMLGTEESFWMMTAEEKDRKTVGFDGMA